MNEKELRRLSRAELLELLLEQTKEAERLRAKLIKAEEMLSDRELRMDNAGDIAHAALEINGVMEAALEQLHATGGTLTYYTNRYTGDDLAGTKLLPTSDNPYYMENASGGGHENCHHTNKTENTTAKIGQTVEFVSTITAYAGTHNLAFHDSMQESLDYKLGSVVIYRGTIDDANIIPMAGNYEVIETGLTDGCTFEVKFSDAFMDTVTAATEIFISYKATLNEKAVIAPSANVSNSQITYGDGGRSEWDPANVYTYQFGIVKTDISNKILTGAEFELYYSKTGTDKIALVVDVPNSITPEPGVTYYRPATDAEIAAPGFVSAKIEAGVAVIWGVRSGVAMYLEETQQPAGYNKLAERHHITALTENNMPVYNLADMKYTSGGVEIENLAGAQLPQTGQTKWPVPVMAVVGMLLITAGLCMFISGKKRDHEA